MVRRRDRLTFYFPFSAARFTGCCRFEFGVLVSLSVRVCVFFINIVRANRLTNEKTSACSSVCVCVCVCVFVFFFQRRQSSVCICPALRPNEKVLPEEAVNHRIVVPEATREAFLQQLCSSSAFLLSSLEQIAAGPLGAEVMVQVCVGVCVVDVVVYVYGRVS